MARQARLPLAGVAHHVMVRGHNDSAVFVDDADRSLYLTILRDCAAAARVQVQAYVLLSGRIHLVVVAEDAGGIGKMMQMIGRRYVAAFNRRHGRSGTLWDGRYRCHALGGDDIVRRCMRYVETRADEGSASGREYSSRAHHVGQRRDGLLSDPPAYWGMGNTPFEREAAWREYLAEESSAREVATFEGALRSGLPVGSVEFRTEVELRTGRVLARRPRGRPRKLGGAGM